MKLNYGHIDAKENKAILFLKGQIGKDINGDSFADEILSSAINNKAIDLYINTVGGSVIQGQSIITAIKLVQSQGVNLRLINSGVAYSMGGFILASGKKGTRFAYDYAMAMIHDPRVSGDVQLSESDKQMIDKAIESVAIMTANATGETIEAIKETMKAERYLSAKEMKQMGIIDEVIQTGMKVSINATQHYELMVACSEITDNILKTIKTNNMSKINNVLLLNAEASEEAQLMAIADLKSKAEKLNAIQLQVEALEAEKNKLVAKLEAAEKASKMVVAESVIGKAIEAGKISAEVKAEWVEDYISNPERTEKKLSAIVPVVASVNEQLEGKASKGGDKKKAEEYAKLMDEPDKMAEMDAKTLDDMEAAYKRMNAFQVKVIE
jgi:ATP-dependent Clp protease protease subunit